MHKRDLAAYLRRRLRLRRMNLSGNAVLILMEKRISPTMHSIFSRIYPKSFHGQENFRVFAVWVTSLPIQGNNKTFWKNVGRWVYFTYSPVLCLRLQVSHTLPGCFSVLKFMKYSQAFYCQKIFLPGVAGTVRVEQTHKASFDRRIEVVIEESFPMFQTDNRQHFFYSKFFIANRFDQLNDSWIIGWELVRYLSGQLVRFCSEINSSGAEMTR